LLDSVQNLLPNDYYISHEMLHLPVIFQISHQFINTVLMFFNEMLLKLIKESRFFAQDVCEKKNQSTVTS